jgi:hypothetical protein
MANIGAVRSISQVGTYEPFDLQVARGQISGHSVLSIFGYQGSVSTTSIPVWENATAYTYITSASTLTLVSSSTSDNTSASVLISGLDSSFNIITETLFLNGTTGVTTVNSYFRVNSMILVSAGSSQTTNVGTITLKQSSNTVSQIAIGIGRSQSTVYTVPAGYSFYLDVVEVNTSNTYAGTTIMTYKVQSINNTTGVKSTLLQQPFLSLYLIQRASDPFAYAEKTDIQWQLSTNTGTVAAGMIIAGKLIRTNLQGT